jgi:HTH-type transcriptional regulator/antitoxin HigA
MLGGSGRVSEVLNRKRPLSVAMVRRLRSELDIPAESLLRVAPATRRPRPSGRSRTG